jgi:hypothetical protein
VDYPIVCEILLMGLVVGNIGFKTSSHSNLETGLGPVLFSLKEDEIKSFVK